MKNKTFGSALLLICVLLGGSYGQPPNAQTHPESVSLIPITFPKWQQKLAGYKGEIVVVDMWATWCAPCVERFPHMVQLYGKYKSRGVRFISMSLDDRDDKGAVARAREFLNRQRAVFENYLIDDDVTDAFQKLDLLGIPAVLIYGRDGKLRYKLTGDNPYKQFTNADVEKAIVEILG